MQTILPNFVASRYKHFFHKLIFTFNIIVILDIVLYNKRQNRTATARNIWICLWEIHKSVGFWKITIGANRQYNCFTRHGFASISQTTEIEAQPWSSRDVSLRTNAMQTARPRKNFTSQHKLILMDNNYNFVRRNEWQIVPPAALARRCITGHHKFTESNVEAQPCSICQIDAKRTRILRNHWSPNANLHCFYIFFQKSDLHASGNPPTKITARGL